MKFLKSYFLHTVLSNKDNFQTDVFDPIWDPNRCYHDLHLMAMKGHSTLPKSPCHQMQFNLISRISLLVCMWGGFTPMWRILSLKFLEGIFNPYQYRFSIRKSIILTQYEMRNKSSLCKIILSPVLKKRFSRKRTVCVPVQTMTVTDYI